MRKQFRCDPSEMYCRDDEHLENNLKFVSMAKQLQFGDMLFWPNFIDAPWQLQMNISDSVINFWPHKMKAHVQYEPKSQVAYGISGIAALVFRVLLESHKQYDDSVLE